MIPKGMTADMLDNQTTIGGSGSNVFTMNPNDAGGVYTDPKSVSSPPPLGIDPDKTPTGTSAIVEPEIIDTKPPKTTDTIIQGGLYPECLQKWKEYSSVITFKSNEEMESSKKEFMTKCMSTSTTGTSQIVEPNLGTPTNTSTTTTTTNTTTILPNLGAFLGSLTGGAGGGAGATEETALSQNKKPFPYWILIVGAVGAYLIFKKEK
jgi:hypothetical protein